MTKQVVKALLVSKYSIACPSPTGKKRKRFGEILSSMVTFRFVFQSSKQSLPPVPSPPIQYVPQQECLGRCFLVWPRCSSPFPTVEAGSSHWWWWQKVPLSCSCCLRLWPQSPWWCTSSVRQKTRARFNGRVHVVGKKKWVSSIQITDFIKLCNFKGTVVNTAKFLSISDNVRILSLNNPNYNWTSYNFWRHYTSSIPLLWFGIYFWPEKRETFEIGLKEAIFAKLAKPSLNRGGGFWQQ